MGMSFGNLVIILIIVLVLFGAGKLPQMMSDMGKGMKAFKDGIKDEDKKNKKTLKAELDSLSPTSAPSKVSAKKTVVKSKALDKSEIKTQDSKASNAKNLPTKAKAKKKI